MHAKMLALAGAAIATKPSRNVVAPPADYVWDILKWQAGESHGAPTAPLTGYYGEQSFDCLTSDRWPLSETVSYLIRAKRGPDFNVSASEYGGGPARIPAFFVHCAGRAGGLPLSSEYTDCDLEKANGTVDAAVLARVLPDPDLTSAHIAISYLFNADRESKTRRNFTVVIVEDWARERPPHNFTAVPTEAA
ncbi:hypothetical protein F4814DRAFT_449752 [Daldinia grandis]|nr:hypothetical protein F4814DRAFT_449752 [Daldinia grandis]